MRKDRRLERQGGVGAGGSEEHRAKGDKGAGDEERRRSESRAATQGGANGEGAFCGLRKQRDVNATLR